MAPTLQECMAFPISCHICTCTLTSSVLMLIISYSNRLQVVYSTLLCFQAAILSYMVGLWEAGVEVEKNCVQPVV